MSTFKDWTPQQLAERELRIVPGSLLRRPAITTAVSLLAEAREQQMKKKTARLDASMFALQPSHDEARLNKTERAYLVLLRARQDVDWIGIQSVTLKIGDDCRLTCDFVYLCDGVLTFVDTKGGFIREDSTIKIKAAARMFPWARFIVAQKISGTWAEKIIRS